MSVTIDVKRANVYAEVQKTTAYEGAHSGAFDNVFSKPEDKEMLERYWTEASAFVTDLLKKYITSLTNNNTGYTAILALPSNFDVAMTTPMNEAAYTYMCNYIIGKWLEMLSIEKSAAYITAATQSFNELKTLLLHRVAPKRPTD